MNREHQTVSAIAPERNEKYEAPLMEIVEVGVERGFADSLDYSREEENATY